jgi:hypothetical protein
MVEQIGMRAPHARGDGLQRHGLRTRFNQNGARRLKRCGAAFFGGETFPFY